MEMKLTVSNGTQNYVAVLTGRSINGLKKKIPEISSRAFEGNYFGTAFMEFRSGTTIVERDEVSFEKHNSSFVIF